MSFVWRHCLKLYHKHTFTFRAEGQTRRTCSQNATERWTGLDTQIHIYVCVYTAIVCIQFLHTHIYTYTVTVIQFFVSVSNHQKIKSIQVCEACVPLVLSSEVFSFLEVWEGSYINIHQMSSNKKTQLRTFHECWYMLNNPNHPLFDSGKITPLYHHFTEASDTTLKVWQESFVRKSLEKTTCWTAFHWLVSSPFHAAQFFWFKKKRN